MYNISRTFASAYQRRSPKEPWGNLWVAFSLSFLLVVLLPLSRPCLLSSFSESRGRPFGFLGGFWGPTGIYVDGCPEPHFWYPLLTPYSHGRLLVRSTMGTAYHRSRGSTLRRTHTCVEVYPTYTTVHAARGRTGLWDPLVILSTLVYCGHMCRQASSFLHGPGITKMEFRIGPAV